MVALFPLKSVIIIIIIIMATVEDVLESVTQSQASKYKTIEVQKDIEPQLDLGNLLTVDQNPLDLKKLRGDKEAYLKSQARDNTQLLFNAIWKLPTERVEEAICVKLPETTTVLPREKPIPKAKLQTKWEQYALLKGIQKRKKGRMVWDEEAKDWRPRWGYKRANDETKDWVIEVPGNADPNEDQFEKRMKAKKERVAKNELQRLRNIARGTKSKVPGVGLTPTEKPSKEEVGLALHLAKKSTASLGKFTEKLPKEKEAKHVGKKRKFEPAIGDFKKEKEQQLNIINVMENKKPKMDITKAVNRVMTEVDQEASSDDRRKRAGKVKNRRGPPRKKGSGGFGKKGSGGFGKKGKAGKGKGAKGMGGKGKGMGGKGKGKGKGR
ncbi:RRS1 [Branchiostoma lanceolatum]|uniref:Ribosome biogenesis regulatory protein n=1 Tax=Branchiostoma lanceolatum TaxID=7740 RepID=A0A8K0F2Z7_BRALA|nr:RRS1 [Branchiostoma lanceolatum]